MLFSSLLPVLAAGLLAQTTEARSPRLNRRSGVKISTSRPTAFKAPSAIEISSNVLTLTKKSSTGSKARSAARLTGLDIPVGNSTELISLFIGEEFAANITFGTETFEVIVDTGSSDTWVVESGFSYTFTQISNENFNITYGDGEYLTGIIGTEEVILAGITVNQTVAVVNYAAWYGDGTTSGLVGLAYPALTSAYKGTDPTLDNSAAGEQIVYNPIFTTMYTEGLVDPLFSLAIERDISGPAGYLALGGVPPVNFTQNFTHAPILITTIEYYPDTYDFYTIEIDGAILNNVTLAGSGGDVQYIVDSGTTLNYFPTSVADAINAAYVPPAVYYDDEGAYIVDCNATAPSLGIQINGTIFYTNPLDMILDAGTDEDGNEICITGIDDGGDEAGDVYILGDTFQKNVVTVFDVGAVVLRFAAREFYSSNDDV